MGIYCLGVPGLEAKLCPGLHNINKFTCFILEFLLFDGVKEDHFNCLRCRFASPPQLSNVKKHVCANSKLITDFLPMFYV